MAVPFIGRLEDADGGLVDPVRRAEEIDPFPMNDEGNVYDELRRRLPETVANTVTELLDPAFVVGAVKEVPACDPEALVAVDSVELDRV